MRKHRAQLSTTGVCIRVYCHRACWDIPAVLQQPTRDIAATKACADAGIVAARVAEVANRNGTVASRMPSKQCVRHLHGEPSALIEAEQLRPGRLQLADGIDALLEGLNSNNIAASMTLACDSAAQLWDAAGCWETSAHDRRYSAFMMHCFPVQWGWGPPRVKCRGASRAGSFPPRTPVAPCPSTVAPTPPAVLTHAASWLAVGRFRGHQAGGGGRLGQHPPRR